MSSSPAVYAGAEDAITAASRLAAATAAGGIHDKRTGHAALKAVLDSFAAGLESLNRAMQDRQNYDPVMAEPSARAAMLVRAAASAMSEGENAIAAYMILQVHELRDSGRQVPHHSQLSGDPA